MLAPIDLIPDVMPLVGYLDDIAAILIAVSQFKASKASTPRLESKDR